MKHLAALGAVIAALVITLPGAATDTGNAPAVATSTSLIVTQDAGGTWHATAIIAQVPFPPPASTANLYSRVIERDGATRAGAIRNLVSYLGALVATSDLEFE